ncbi:RHS repeat-associated core domain-containing protein [Roseovarius sp.]|uniref:RHS repeat-associated core domain-containing protein n=1 Tax=Roseovarius sp. TaxID=1486281 RepID=UPI003BA987BB
MAVATTISGYARPRGRRRFASSSYRHANWMREYDPSTGRYLQADPLGLVDGASVYGYALQNPGGMWIRGGSSGLNIPALIGPLSCAGHPVEPRIARVEAALPFRAGPVARSVWYKVVSRSVATI